ILPLPFTFLSDTKLGSRNTFDPRLKLVRDSIGKPGIALIARESQGIAVPAGSDSRRIRIGALDVTFATSNPWEDLPCELRWELAAPADTDPDKRYSWKEAHVQLSWAVEKVSPGGEDDLPGEIYVEDGDDDGLLPPEKDERAIERLMRRERPLVIPFDQN